VKQKESLAKMEHDEDLARLEQFVEKLIDSHNQLKNENSEINVLLQAKQQEIDELQEVIKSLQEDRSVMHNRVGGLIERIDEWEKSFEQVEPGQDSDPVTGTTKSRVKKSSSLFNVKAEKSSGPALR
jgi:chromosome segregation ATPase